MWKQEWQGSGQHFPDAYPGKITVLPEKDDEIWLSKVQDPQPSGMCMCQPRAEICQFLCVLCAVLPVQTIMFGPPLRLLSCPCEAVGTLLQEVQSGNSVVFFLRQETHYCFLLLLSFFKRTNYFKLWQIIKTLGSSLKELCPYCWTRAKMQVIFPVTSKSGLVFL